MPTAIKDIFRAVPGGADIGAQSNIITVKKHDGDATLEANIDTDSDGLWTFTYVPEGSAGAGWTLNPGEVYWEGTYAGQTRGGSSIASGLWGSNSIAELPVLFSSWGDGVLSNSLLGTFACTLDGVGMDVDIAAGEALLDGILVRNPAARELTVTAADGSNPRIDRVILELTRTAGDTFGKAVLKMLNGTAAASPTAPTLTDDANTLQISLAQIRSNAGVTTPTSITDERAYALTAVTRNTTRLNTERIAPGATALSTTAAEIATLAHAPSLVSGVWYDITITADMVVDGASSVAMLACYIEDAVTGLSDYQSAPAQSGLVTLSNAHSASVLGAGTTILCGVKVKKSGSSAANYYSGVTRIEAVPRS